MDNGTTEGGSSGSPLFNQNKRVVGQLHGGESGCPPVTKYYGQFHISWTGDSTDATRLSSWLDPCNSGTLTTNTSRSPYISGPSVICSSGTYSISNLPQGASITWQCGPFLYISSGQNTNSCTFIATGNGSSGVRAVITINCGSFTIPFYDVYVGTPPPDISYAYDASTNTQVAMPIAGEEYYFQLFTDNPSTTSSDYVWGIDPPFGSEYFPWIDNGKQIYFTAPEPGIYTFSAKQNWTCGWSNFATEYIEFYESGYFLMFTPNPSSGETELMIESEVETAFDVNEEWNLEVYDSKQLLKEKKSRLKGQSYKFQTSGWREGIYVVRVKFKDQVLQGKLVVKK